MYQTVKMNLLKSIEYKKKFHLERQKLEEEIQNINKIKSYNYDSDFLHLLEEFLEET